LGSAQGFEAVLSAAAIPAGKIGSEPATTARIIPADAAIAAKAVSIAAFATATGAIVAGEAAIAA